MNSAYVTDTMALILRLEKRKSSRHVKTIFEAVERGEVTLVIPALVLAEIGYLSERHRIDTNLAAVRDYCRHHSEVKIEPLSEDIIFKSFEIDDIPELHDRIIAGAAAFNNLSLITNDPEISASKYVVTDW